MANLKHKKHDKIVQNQETEKVKKMTKAFDKVLKQQENSEKLRKYGIDPNFLENI